MAAHDHAQDVNARLTVGVREADGSRSLNFNPCGIALSLAPRADSFSYLKTWALRPQALCCHLLRRFCTPLLAFALLQQEIISFYNHLVAGLQTVDDFNEIASLDSRLHLTFLIGITFRHKNHALALIFENRGLRH